MDAQKIHSFDFEAMTEISHCDVSIRVAGTRLYQAYGQHRFTGLPVTKSPTCYLVGRTRNLGTMHSTGPTVTGTR